MIRFDNMSCWMPRSDKVGRRNVRVEMSHFQLQVPEFQSITNKKKQQQNAAFCIENSRRKAKIKV